MLFTRQALVSCFHNLILNLVSFTHSSEKLKFLSWFFVQPHNADMALCTIPVAQAAPKPATTGTRLALATNPVWPAATVWLTWCSVRATVLNPCPALAGDPSDSGDPAHFILSAGERPKTHKNPHRGTGSFVNSSCIARVGSASVSPDLLERAALVHIRFGTQYGERHQLDAQTKTEKKGTCTKL